MTYTDLSENLNNYLEIYKSGLKKQANAKISEIVSYISDLPNNDRDSILFRFLSDYCDNHIWDSLKQRGNGDIPYHLKEYILSWLTPRCEEKKMPELRWYYEMFVHHKVGYEYALKYLECAYLSKECDQKTVDLLFDSYIDTLAWGAHHFPDGCIIEAETKNFCIQKCEEILNEKQVSEHLVYQLKYYKILYMCYEKYVKDGRTEDFDNYLNEANIDFYYTKAYYYQK